MLSSTRPDHLEKRMRTDTAALKSEYHLVSAAMALNASDVSTWSSEERALSKGVARFGDLAARAIAQQIQRGKDPLGDAFSRLRSAEQRREDGATYTPAAIVKAIVRWAAAHHASPVRIIDPGVGSGRFLLEAGRITGISGGLLPDRHRISPLPRPLAGYRAQDHRQHYRT